MSLNLHAADAYAQTKDFNKSQIYLEKARALAPDNDSIKVRLANVMLANGNSAKAIDLLEQASKSQKTVIESDKTLVMMLIEDKQFDRALRTLSDLERKSPKSASIQGLRALAFKGKNDIPAARKALEQALAIDPAYFPAVKQLVEFDREAKNYAAAKKRLNDLLKKDVKNADAMFELAGIAYLEKQEPAYLSWLEKVVSTQPSYLQAYALLVNFHLAKQAPQKALTIARSAASGNPENPNALRLLGSTQSALKDSPGAVSTFTRMTEKDPTSPTAFNSLAKAQADSGDFKAAKASLQKALQLQPDFLDALITLFHVELQNGNAETALKVAGEIQRIHPAKVTGYHHAGDALIMLGRNELAIKAYEQAMAKGGGSVILAKLHKALVMQGKEPLAQQKAGAWLAKHPDDLLIRGTLADSHLANQRYAQAVAEYQQLIKLTAPDPSHLFLNNLAYAYQQAKDPRALATAEQAYKLAPKQSFVLDTYGSILLEAGRAKDALPHLRAALDLAPGSTSTRYTYALALSQTGKKTEAKRELQTLLESGKDFPERARANELISRL